MFNIETASDFYNVVVQDYDEYVADPASARKAIHSALSAYHLHEWVWGEWLKKDKGLRAKLGIQNIQDFLKFLDLNCPWFVTIQALAVGAKHFSSGHGIETSLIQGFGQGPYGSGSFGSSYLLIDHGGQDDVHRFKTAMELLEVVVRFWRDFFRAYHPTSNLLYSEYHLKPI